MANLYGVSNPVIIPVFMSIPGGSVNCAAGVETNIAFSSALASISAGVYYPQIFGSIGGTITAAGMSAVSFAARIGAGADFLTLNFSPQQFTNAYWFCLPVAFVGPPSVIPWQGGGSILNVMATWTGATAIVYAGSTNLWATLYRAPDQ